MSQNMQHEKADFSKQQNVEIIFVLSRKINYIFGIILKATSFGSTLPATKKNPSNCSFIRNATVATITICTGA